jgi:surface protein
MVYESFNSSNIISKTAIIFDGVNLNNLTNVQDMFHRARGLTYLDLSSFDTRNVTDMSYMFYDCENLT